MEKYYFAIAIAGLVLVVFGMGGVACYFYAQSAKTWGEIGEKYEKINETYKRMRENNG